ncbi:MAG: hypothetical protein SF162_14765 [bacterium]|nr:hypothetical protein [bacterium]
MKRIILYGMLVMLAALPAAAQTEIAGRVRVIFDSLQFVHGRAVNPLPVRPDAEFPFTVGDTLTTNEFGRALLTLEAGRLLMLPGSTVRVDALGADGAAFSLTAGRIVVAPTAADGGTTPFQVTAGGIITSGGSFAVQIVDDTVWVVAGADSTALTVVDESVTLEPGTGLRVRGGLPDQAVSLDGIGGFALIDGLLDGCPGVVAGRGERSLNVRIGPSRAYDVLGNVPTDLPVFLMAVSPAGERFRIQFLNGFGWILADGVAHTCTHLPELPYSAVETIVRIIRPQPDEIELLRPYYGDPADDPIFYILPPTS